MPNPSEKCSLQCEYEYIAHQINREDSLVNSRMTWVLQLNGFLFATLALAGKDFALNVQLQHLLLILISAVGIAVTLSGLMGVQAAHLQLTDLKACWTQERFPNWPRPFGNPLAHRLGQWPSRLPLTVLSISWTIILVYVLSTGKNAV